MSTPTDQPDELDAILEAYGLSLATDSKLGTTKEQAKAALLAREQRIKAQSVYGFHEYIIGKDLIRPETDQAYNYGRLHKAIDDFIAALSATPPKE